MCSTPSRAGEVDFGFVAIENSIEGTVNLTQDELAFSHDLLIQREVVLDIEHCLMAKPGTTLADVKVVLSIPVATAQCHTYLRAALPGRAAGRQLDGRGGADRQRGGRAWFGGHRPANRR